MKTVIAILLLSFTSLVFASCSGGPDNKVHEERISPTTGQTEYLIKPTWGQAHDFADERNDRAIWVLIGWAFLIACAVYTFGLVADVSWFPERVANHKLAVAGIPLLLALSVLSFKWQPMNIKWNNDKWIPASQFERDKGTHGAWDSLRKNCMIVYGPYDCYKK